MASIQRRTLKDGSHSYRVAWRVDGKQHTRTFRSQVEAEEFAAGAGRRRLKVTLHIEGLNGGGGPVRGDWTWTR